MTDREDSSFGERHARLFVKLFELSSLLQQAHIRFALIGGVALSARGFPRGTTDIDFLVHEDDIQKARSLAQEIFPEILHEGEEFSSYLAGDQRVDLQHARRPPTKAMLDRADSVDFGEAFVPVVQAEDLIGLKLQAVHNTPSRLQDLVDIQRLLEANPGKLDLDLIRSYFRLFDRERELDNILRLVARG